MKNKNALIIFISILIFGFLIFKSFKKTDESIIVGNLNKLALLMSKAKDESILSLANKLNEAINYFDLPFDLNIEYEDNFNRSIYIKTKQDLKDIILAIKSKYPVVDVNFESNQVTIDKNMANVQTVARLIFDDEQKNKVYDLYDLKIQFVKNDKKEWLIQNIILKHKNTENN